MAEKTIKTKKPIPPQTMSIVYIVIIVCCVVLLITLIVLAGLKVKENQELKAKEEAIVEQYNNLANENENLSDPDYAEVYFDGGKIYIPSQDIIIEYHG
jgi:cell division protein FtsL